MKKKTVKVSAVLLSLAIALTGTAFSAEAAYEWTYADASIKAPNWYVRYGMNDRASSFAVETILRYSIWNNEEIRNKNFEFAWLKVHLGDYDVTEAYAWLDSVLAAE